MTDPIFITGAPRSGTSVTAEIFHTAGAFAGEVRHNRRANPTGQWENKALVSLNKELLQRFGYDPRGQKPVPLRSEDVTPLHGLADRVREELVRQGWDGRSAWFFKDPKTLWLWPVWAAAFPQARWIVVMRNTEDIARSCMATGFMNAYRTVPEWTAYAEHCKHYIAPLLKGAEHTAEVCPELYIGQNDFDPLLRTVRWCGLEIAETTIRKVVKRKYWHGADS